MTADEPVIMVCGVPDDAPPEVWDALTELGRAAAAAEEARRAALSDEERAAEDARRAAGERRIRERSVRLRSRKPAPRPVDGACPACGKFVALALQAEPPQWACIDIDCVHGGGHPLPAGGEQ